MQGRGSEPFPVAPLTLTRLSVCPARCPAVRPVPARAVVTPAGHCPQMLSCEYIFFLDGWVLVLIFVLPRARSLSSGVILGTERGHLR